MLGSGLAVLYSRAGRDLSVISTAPRMTNNNLPAVVRQVLINRESMTQRDGVGSCLPANLVGRAALRKWIGRTAAVGIIVALAALY